MNLYSARLRVPLRRSTAPLDCGRYVRESTWRTPHCVQSSLTAPWNSLPWSHCRVTGGPSVHHMLWSHFATSLEVGWSRTVFVQANREYRSTMTRNPLIPDCLFLRIKVVSICTWPLPPGRRGHAARIGLRFMNHLCSFAGRDALCDEATTDAHVVARQVGV